MGDECGETDVSGDCGDPAGLEVHSEIVSETGTELACESSSECVSFGTGVTAGGVWTVWE